MIEGVAPNYECHITIRGDVDASKKEIESHWGWSFSCIHGDPDLGDKTFCYATRHFTGWESAKSITESTAQSLRNRGLSVVRAKIEHIIWDVRY